MAGSPYGIIASDAIGGGLSNYAITYLPRGSDRDAAPITVGGNDRSRPISQRDPPLTFAVTAGSLVNCDALSGALATTADSSSLAASYPITQETLAASLNYALTFVDGTLVVTATPASVASASDF